MFCTIMGYQISRLPAGLVTQIHTQQDVQQLLNGELNVQHNVQVSAVHQGLAHSSGG